TGRHRRSLFPRRAGTVPPHHSQPGRDHADRQSLPQPQRAGDQRDRLRSELPPRDRARNGPGAPAREPDLVLHPQRRGDRERAGDINSGQPKLTLGAVVGYRAGGLGLFADLTHIGGGRYDNTFVQPTDINDNTIPSRTYLGLQAGYDFGRDGRRREVFFHVANLFNVRPPPVFVFAGGANYERVGRSFRAGVRFEI